MNKKTHRGQTLHRIVVDGKEFFCSYHFENKGGEMESVNAMSELLAVDCFKSNI